MLVFYLLVLVLLSTFTGDSRGCEVAMPIRSGVKLASLIFKPGISRPPDNGPKNPTGPNRGMTPEDPSMLVCHTYSSCKG